MLPLFSVDEVINEGSSYPRDRRRPSTGQHVDTLQLLKSRMTAAIGRSVLRPDA